MSILFLKSEDNQAKASSYNPNKPYRFSNYLTQPLTIPPNSQVAYVSSQFNITANGQVINEPSYILTTDEMHSVFNMPTTMQYNSNRKNIDDGFVKLLNDYALSANESGMEDDFTGLKYNSILAYGETQNVSNTGFQLLYDAGNDKAVLKTIIRIANDQYNLDFNCCRGNPGYNATGWLAGPSGTTGATIGPGLNFGSFVDTKFQNDCGNRAQNSPALNSSFKGGNCYGLNVNTRTDLFNALTRIYEGGANFYNTGYSVYGLDGMGGRYNNRTATAGSITLPPFNAGLYPMIMSKVGIKKCVGGYTPTNTQQNNRGGHQHIGHLNSGGYAIWTMSNADQIEQNRFYNAGSVSKEGFTGFMECSVGVHSLPFIQQRGYEEAIDFGETESVARNINTQLDYFNTLNDLNASSSIVEPRGALARYLFGMDFRIVGNVPNKTLTAQAKIAKCLPGYSDAGYSQYELVGNALDIQQLSNGINTATNPPYVFSNDTYSINTFNTTPGRTGAMLFFRFRWVNKTQMVIEFTLSVQGYAGTYNNATDEPYAPSTENVFPDPVGQEADPRDKWCLLARMNLGTLGVGNQVQTHIPSYMGDMCLVQYPVANQSDTSNYYMATKGYYNVRRTNRYFDDNSNALLTSKAPFVLDNQFFSGSDTLGVLRYDPNAPLDDTKTSEQFIQSGFDGTASVGFNTSGILVDEIHALGIPLQTGQNANLYRTTIGEPAFQVGQPPLEIYYQLGFNTIADTQDVVDLQEDTLDATGATFELVSSQDIGQTSEAFSNHIQISNLPIYSQNGVISGVNKTIYIVNSLCIQNTMDTQNYRSYCDKTPFPLWIDLNNLETIQLNKVDVLISKDDNTEQKNLTGESEVVVMFRQKETGILPNSIQSQSIPMTRTY